MTKVAQLLASTQASLGCPKATLIYAALQRLEQTPPIFAASPPHPHPTLARKKVGTPEQTTAFPVCKKKLKNTVLLQRHCLSAR